MVIIPTSVAGRSTERFAFEIRVVVIKIKRRSLKRVRKKEAVEGGLGKIRRKKAPSFWSLGL